MAQQGLINAAKLRALILQERTITMRTSEACPHEKELEPVCYSPATIFKRSFLTVKEEQELFLGAMRDRRKLVLSNFWGAREGDEGRPVHPAQRAGPTNDTLQLTEK